MSRQQRRDGRKRRTAPPKVHLPTVCGVLGAVCALLVLPAFARACPNCKEALIDPAELPQRLSMARGYALSISLLLAVPVGLVGSIAALVARESRRLQAAREFLSTTQSRDKGRSGH